MLTRMTDEDWSIILEVLAASRSRRGDKGRDDRRFLEALHFFTVHNITWRALPVARASGRARSSTGWRRSWMAKSASTTSPQAWFARSSCLSRAGVRG
ncbi:MAG TPA: transposase [Geminicoccaceae bacterium]|nr:transposase [Geminicoccaceae bacterium]